MRPERIFYLVGDGNRPFGGEKHSYQHVDMLNSAGFDAYALHGKKGFRLSWFENDTRVLDLESFWSLYDRERDYLVVPEAYGAFILNLPGRVVIFNKNLYQGYDRLTLSPQDRYPFSHQRVVAIFSVSTHNLDHLRFAFPGTPIYRMYPHIDTERFAFRPIAEKQRRIACSAKEKIDLGVLYHTLQARAAADLNRLASYQWTFLQDFSEHQVAEVLGESLILIALSTREGLPRTVLEGMACGCLVVGHGTGPLLECLPEEYQYQRDDFIDMARGIEEIAGAFPHLERWAAVARRGRAMAETYTRAQQKAHLVKAWEEILGHTPRG